MAFLLGPDGREILSRNFQPPLTPAAADDPAKLPNDLRRLVK
jgi:hypothetical protein